VKPHIKRFEKAYKPIADVIASADIDQEDREKIADALTRALTGKVDFLPDLFWYLCADPLCTCGGPDGKGCPDERRIRVMMHYKGGRAITWQHRKPRVNCTTCGPVRT
jgi:hypothetical protein